MSKLFKKRYLLRQPPNLTQGPPGPPGPPGPSTPAATDTDNITYRGQVLTDVIDDLLYVDLLINSFSAPQIVFDRGQVITSLNVTWAYNKDVVSQSIAGPITVPTLTAPERSKTLTVSNQSSNFTLTLTANDGEITVNRNLSISFQSRIFWGQAAQPGVINSAFIQSLQNELKVNRTKSFQVNLGANIFGWFAHPVSYGIAAFKTNGFDGGFDAPVTVSFTNTFGFTESYYVYRTTNSNLGVTNCEVV